MTWLSEDHWLLVVDGNRVTGVVTPSDLNRYAARTYLYLLLADFESQLANAIRRVVGPEGATALLSDTGRNEVKARFEMLKEGDVEIDELAAMQLSDLVAIGKKQPSVRAGFGVDSASEWKALTGPVVRLRHAVMHPSRPYSVIETA